MTNTALQAYSAQNAVQIGLYFIDLIDWWFRNVLVH